MIAKRTIICLMGLISLAGLMGCSGSGTVEPAAAGAAIAFSADLPERQAVTRSGTPLEDELPVGSKTFKVWAYKNTAYEAGSYTSYQTVMSGYTVGWTENTAYTTTTNTHDWEYILPAQPDQTIKFWDWSAMAYRFFAVAPHDALVTPTMDGSGDNYTVTLPADATVEASNDATTEEKIAATPYFSRLWFSTGNAAVYPTRQFGQPVVLEFTKPLARVRFMFIYSYPPESIKLKNKEFKPSDGTTKIACKGTVTVSYPLKGTGTSETFSVDTGDGSGALTAFTEDYMEEGTKKWYTVLPAASQDSYTLSVTFNNEPEPRTAVVPANYMTWLPGYSYTYVFKITEQGGVEIEMVLAAVTKWGDPYVGEYTVYNW